MDNPRKYGSPPFTAAVIHGGPGAPGTMAPVARILSVNTGIVEPLQTADFLEGQVQELKALLRKSGSRPMTLIGSSWGAMLAFIFAAHFPGQVKKLLLVGSGPFEESYAENLMDVRLSRLQPGERDKALLLITILADGNPREKDNALHQLGGLFTRTDAYNPITLDTEVIEVKYRIYEKVWAQAQDLRATGQLLKMGKSISCPVVAIHGDYDPHPAAGIKIPLEKVLTHFKFIQLEHCGHLPWIEKEAREPFFNILAEELATT